TFDLSIQPFEDCCTIFAPPQPKTKPHLDKVHQYEERLDIEGLIERALTNIKVEEIVPESLQEQEDEFAELL
ncbi:MAG: tRNA 4-thiouridine(8) synthase ThiI, partial [Tetragenococcus halophilus]|nr:tRNA 4-thiouridine(8) synthase ThiI [Tetragenococcus halophilus]MDN6196446.1 tRNA 4-thiouridine(8) synthase ThiI [Atopostipes suicloacalis]MDN6608002.1 tRNA 4-thiouridine(8) synthase ThiI [Tetragenococcus halophilus]